jgi:hypothetical protein
LAKPLRLAHRASGNIRPDDDGCCDGWRDTLAGGRVMFEGDGCRHDSYGAEARHSDDEDRHRKGTAAAAAEA